MFQEFKIGKIDNFLWTWCFILCCPLRWWWQHRRHHSQEWQPCPSSSVHLAGGNRKTTRPWTGEEAAGISVWSESHTANRLPFHHKWTQQCEFLSPVLVLSLNSVMWVYFWHLCFVCFSSQSETAVSHGCIQSLLLKFSAQELIEVREPTSAPSSSTTSSSTSTPTVVVAVDHTKLWAMIGSVAGAQRTGVKRKAEDQMHSKRAAGFSPSLQSSASPPHSSTTSLTPASSSEPGPSASGSGTEKKGRSSKSQSSHLDMEIESLLNQQSTKEQQSKKVTEGFCCCCFSFFCNWLKIGVSLLLQLSRDSLSHPVKPRDSGAAERQHSQGTVHRGKVQIPRPSSGPRVLRSWDQRRMCSRWRHASAMHQVTLSVCICFTKSDTVTDSPTD